VKIARIFPTKTSMSPTDKNAYFDAPDMFTPNDYDEAHISITFTWDIDKGHRIAKEWGNHARVVKIGGVAVDGESKNCFVSGMYLREGITITSRGCPNNCSFCLVNKNGMIEFDDFPEGNIVQDNNILACSDRHWGLVMSMLRKQKDICMKGGLEARRVTTKKAENLRSLRIRELWLACDHDGAIEPLSKAIQILRKAGFSDSHFYCFVLIGMEEQRLRAVRNLGVMPFAQLYMKPENKKTEYTDEMKKYQRLMSRPAITRNIFNNPKPKSQSTL